jgi:ACS family tartrate transporter-like MFS transporter
MIAWGVTSSCMVFVTTAKMFYTLRFLLGVTEAGFYPGVILYLKHWFPPSARARTVAWFMTAGPLSGVVGGPISGALLGLHHFGLAGWQWLFLMEGVPAILLGIVVPFFLSDRPEQARWLQGDHLEWLTSALRDENAFGSASGTTIRAALLNGRIWLLTIVYFGLTTCSYGVSLWLPNVIRSLSGVSNVVIGVLSSIPYIAAAIAMVLVGIHSDRTRERRWHTAVPAFAGAIALLLAAYSSSVAPVIAALSVAVLGVFAMCGPFWAMPTTFLSGTAAAAGIAIINSFGNLGGFFGPYIIGTVRNATGGFRGGLLVVSATLALGGFVALAIRFAYVGSAQAQLRTTVEGIDSADAGPGIKSAD